VNCGSVVSSTSLHSQALPISVSGLANPSRAKARIRTAAWKDLVLLTVTFDPVHTPEGPLYRVMEGEPGCLAFPDRIEADINGVPHVRCTGVSNEGLIPLTPSSSIAGKLRQTLKHLYASQRRPRRTIGTTVMTIFAADTRQRIPQYPVCWPTVPLD
jgi:hypothetical protein